MCRLFVHGQLKQHELAYFPDAMQLAKRIEFADPFVADSVSEFTDPEINGVFTPARALEIINGKDAQPITQHGRAR